MTHRFALQIAASASLAFWFALDAAAQQRITIPDRVACAQCRIELQKFATLGKATDSVLLTLGTRFAIDETGRIFAAPTATEGRIAVFDKAGTLVRTIGRRGKGPGEFSSIDELLYYDGRLYVVDADANRINVFGRSLDLEHSFQFVGDFEVARPELIALPNRLVLAPILPVPARPGSVHLFDMQGKRIRTVGELLAPPAAASGSQETARAQPSREPEIDGTVFDVMRVVADAGGGRFWTARMSRYELELWDTTGTRQMTVARTAPWFLPWRMLPAKWWQTPWPPMVKQIHQSSDGVLWASITVPDASFKPQPGNEEPGQEEAARFIDILIEAIDPRAGTLLATRRFPHLVFLAGHSGHIAEFTEDASGYVTWTISRLVLTRPPAR